MIIEEYPSIRIITQSTLVLQFSLKMKIIEFFGKKKEGENKVSTG